jgi:molecular chaperone GrpE (heat shock protein)
MSHLPRFPWGRDSPDPLPNREKGGLWQGFGYGRTDMPDPSPTVDIDFTAQMRALVIEAEQAQGEKDGKPADRRANGDLPHTAPEIALGQLLRPVLMGLESLMRSQSVQNMALDRLEKALEAHAGVPEVLSEARQSLDQRSALNRVMFDALHGELKRYKDDFLLESIIRPVVRDLISLYDDARELHRQLSHGKAGIETQKVTREMTILKTLEDNLEHHIQYMLEVLERMEVRIVPQQLGKLDKRNQKVVAREPALKEEDDLIVIRSVRPAFSWRNRLFRPEEVVVMKWGLSGETANDGAAPETTSA